MRVWRCGLLTISRARKVNEMLRSRHLKEGLLKQNQSFTPPTILPL